MVARTTSSFSLSISSSFAFACICESTLQSTLSAARRQAEGGAGCSSHSRLPSHGRPLRHPAFRECGGCGMRGMPPLSYFSHSPWITFRKPLFFTSRRGTLQHSRGQRGFVPGDSPSVGQTLLHSALTQAVWLSRRVLPSLSASLLRQSWFHPAQPQ